MFGRGKDLPAPPGMRTGPAEGPAAPKETPGTVGAASADEHGGAALKGARGGAPWAPARAGDAKGDDVVTAGGDDLADRVLSGLMAAERERAEREDEDLSRALEAAEAAWARREKALVEEAEDNSATEAERKRAGAELRVARLEHIRETAEINRKR